MKLNRVNFPQHNTKYTNKVVQFGEGNFLRCFVDWQIDILNEKTGLDAGITIVRPRDNEHLPMLNTQDGLYTTIVRGIDENNNLVNDRRVITSINEELSVYKEYSKVEKLFCDSNLEFMFSNTTEAGIVYDGNDNFEDVPPNSFPGKLTKLLHKRYTHFAGDSSKGLIIVPCELIDYNGEELKKIVFQYCELWNLEAGFKLWLDTANTWCSTLVDRIVPGYPRAEVAELQKELGYEDMFMVTGEYFHLFVIQGPKWLEEKLNLKESGLNIKIVEDIKPYKERKVGILNGAHTAIVPVSYLYGIDRVKESMDNKDVREFLETLIFSEIIPSLDMDKEELKEFASAVINRFNNPFIQHELLSISLNSMFKYKTRILPQFLTYVETEKAIPKYMAFSLAALIVFYRGKRGEEIIPLNDEPKFLELFADLWSKYDGTLTVATRIAESVLGLRHWGENLNEIVGLTEMVGNYIYAIDKDGVKSILENKSL